MSPTLASRCWLLLHAKEQWLAAEQKEIDAMTAHDVWDEVPSSEPEQKGSPVITSRWVYRLKRKVDHTVEQFKARLTARGFLQVFGVDYDEVFAAVVLLKSFRLFIALSVLFGWRVTQLDIGNAFLNGNLDKPVYMKHPDGFPGTPGTVLRLKKSIYGLKNAPRIWWNRLFSVLSSLGFRKNRADPCVLQHATWAFIICHHTDDLALSTNDEVARKKVVDTLSAEFKVKDMGDLNRYVGIEREDISDDSVRGVRLHQRSYVESILDRFGMSSANPAPTPGIGGQHLTKQQSPQTDDEKAASAKLPYKQAIGSLWYAANGTRIDITAQTSATAAFSSCPGNEHWIAVKRILRYLVGSAGLGLCYTAAKDVFATIIAIIAYSDSSWADCKETRRSRSGYVVTVAGGPVMWSSKMQKALALSSCEAELYALCECIKEVLFLVNWLSDFGYAYETPVIYVELLLPWLPILSTTQEPNTSSFATSLFGTRSRMAKSR
jgi:hypothetical protein